MTSMRQRAVLAIGALLLVARPTSAGPIYLGHEYEVVLAQAITWENARAAAQVMGTGWDLATIADQAENDFVEGLLGTVLPQRSHFWLGGTDSVAEGIWQWVDGTPFVFNGWFGGEPNDAGGEDFLAYDWRAPNWAWNDASNASAGNLIRGYVAERSVSAVPEPTSLLLLGTGAAGLAAKSRRRNKRV